MKSLFAILFGLLLAWTQCAFMPAYAASAPVNCCGTRSCEMPCCARSESPVSQPVVPARAVSPNQSQLLLAVLARLTILTPQSSADFSFPAHNSPAKAVAVPIYERHCSYLI
jgi:hypothetical protein